MTSRIRFASARQVFETFPALADMIAAAPGDATPLAFARKLALSERPDDALALLAFLLPRRESIWWACQGVRAIQGPDDALVAAEAWVRESDEARRRAAFRLGESADRKAASTWLALGVWWSGGAIGPIDAPPLIKDRPEIAQPPAHPAPHMTAAATNAALALALAGTGARREAWIAACVEAGIRFAEGGDARPKLAPIEAPAAAASQTGRTANPFA